MTKPIHNDMHKRKLGEFYDIIPLKLQTKRHAEIQTELCVKFDVYSKCYDVYLHSTPLNIYRGFNGDVILSKAKGKKMFRHVLRTRNRDADDILYEVRAQFAPGVAVPDPRW